MEHSLTCAYCGNTVEFTDEPVECQHCGQDHWEETWEDDDDA